MGVIVVYHEGVIVFSSVFKWSGQFCFSQDIEKRRHRWERAKHMPGKPIHVNYHISASSVWIWGQKQHSGRDNEDLLGGEENISIYIKGVKTAFGTIHQDWNTRSCRHVWWVRSLNATDELLGSCSQAFPWIDFCNVKMYTINGHRIGYFW